MDRESAIQAVREALQSNGLPGDDFSDSQIVAMFNACRSQPLWVDLAMNPRMVVGEPRRPINLDPPSRPRTVLTGPPRRRHL